jgi:7-cyano-7-deazaguanine synthase
MKALLLSGGLDSCALGWWKRPDLAVTVDYGQRAAEGEIAAACAVATELGIRHEVVAVDLSALGTGALSHRAAVSEAPAAEWWPYRNQMLVTLTAMRFAGEGLSEIMIGAVATDYYADARPAFIRALDKALAVQESHVRLTAPARWMSTLNLLRKARFPPQLLGLTFSCDVNPYACGRCGSCQKRAALVEQYVRHMKGEGRSQTCAVTG